MNGQSRAERADYSGSHCCLLTHLLRSKHMTGPRCGNSKSCVLFLLQGAPQSPSCWIGVHFMALPLALFSPLEHTTGAYHKIPHTAVPTQEGTPVASGFGTQGDSPRPRLKPSLKPQLTGLCDLKTTQTGRTGIALFVGLVVFKVHLTFKSTTQKAG